jgi:hypothetical protein
MAAARAWEKNRGGSRGMSSTLLCKVKWYGRCPACPAERNSAMPDQCWVHCRLAELGFALPPRRGRLGHVGCSYANRPAAATNGGIV